MRVQETAGVSFDIWKTLVKSNPLYKPARDAYIAERLSAPLDEVRAAVRKVDVWSDEQSDATGVQYGPVERLALIAKQQGIEVSEADLAAMAGDIQELFLEYPLQANEPNLVDTLSGLSERKAIVLTSNTGFIDGQYMRKALDKIGILESTDARVFSNEIGVAKPDLRIFQAAAARLALEMCDIVHVGDNPIADYEGARRAGMEAVLLREDTDAADAVVSAPTIRDAVDRGLF